MARNGPPLSEPPGEEPVTKGIADLARGTVTTESSSSRAPRLAQIGLTVVRRMAEPEHRLCGRLRAEDADAAHSRYHALVRRLVSFERAAECAS